MPVHAMESYGTEGYMCTLWNMLLGCAASKPAHCKNVIYVGDVDSLASSTTSAARDASADFGSFTEADFHQMMMAGLSGGMGMF